MKSKTENSDKDDFDGWDNEYEFVKDVTSQVINKGNPGLDMEAVDDLLTLIGYKKLKAENEALREAVKECKGLLIDCRAYLDNSLSDMKENGDSDESWSVLYAKSLFDRCEPAIEKARNLLKP